MIRDSALDRRSLLTGSVIVVAIGLPALFVLEELLWLLPAVFLGGIGGGLRAGSDTDVTINGTVGALVGYGLLMPIIAVEHLWDNETFVRASTGEAVFYVGILSVFFVVFSGMLALVFGYLGATVASVISSANEPADDGHRYFE